VKVQYRIAPQWREAPTPTKGEGFLGEALVVHVQSSVTRWASLLAEGGEYSAKLCGAPVRFEPATGHGMAGARLWCLVPEGSSPAATVAAARLAMGYGAASESAPPAPPSERPAPPSTPPPLVLSMPRRALAKAKPGAPLGLAAPAPRGATPPRRGSSR
jgi:hypothetical protein